MKFNAKFKTALVGAVLAVSAAAGISGSVTAAPGFEVETTYYDANGNYVGSRLLTCSGRMYTWGQVTSNFDVSREPCDLF